MTDQQQSPDHAPSTLEHDSGQTVAQKTAATVLRNKQQRRADRLLEIREQTADGTLTIRQMTAAEHVEASEATRNAANRNQARKRR